MERRNFLKTVGAAASLGAGLSGIPCAWAAGPSLAIVVDPADPVVAAAPCKWAVQELQARLQARGLTARMVPSIGQVEAGEICVLACGPVLQAPAILPAASRPPASAESFAISNGTVGGRRSLIAAGRDPRGLTYALLELADRLDYETSAAAAFEIAGRIAEQPANRVRSVLRAFVSEVEDKPWFYDTSAWRDYLTMLATHRFNRFNLSFGIGYDFVSEIRDSYFHFAYPFLVKVPGYNVEVSIAQPFGGKPVLLSNDERARNLEILQFITAATAERGMDFQLGLWTHAWNFDAAPHATHRIIGLTPATHAEYCRDALHALLVACPAISGVTLRTHGESGVPEASYGFWKTVFSGISAAGRKIEIDQHAKGIDAEMIGLAQATGMPTAVSPKFWAEHMGLPYHQAAIRPLEMPKPAAAKANGKTGALMALSNGSRNFLRYGYGDLLREDRKYVVFYRIWPGTQRLLLWGDPPMADAYGRAAGFAGSAGVEWMEPLTFKGRKGSGLAGGRDGYAGVVSPSVRDWEKYLYTYRVWGRGIYNPESSADARKRYLQKALGVAAESGAAALELSSRILPTITTAHMPSAANANYWPEIYTNQSIVVADAPDPYSDTPEPKRFGTVSPLDSQLFCSIDRCADELLKGTRGATYSPIDVAVWLEELAHDSDGNLADVHSATEKTLLFHQWAVDIAIQNNLGRFFGAKFRAGVLYSIYTGSGDPAALEAAIQQYGKARAAWKTITDIADSVYREDLTFGYAPQLRGSWRDRLAAIDRDVVAMTTTRARAAGPAVSAASAIAAALATSRRSFVGVEHKPVTRFRAGAPIAIEASLNAGSPGKMKLWYRRVNQAEKWVETPMEAVGGGFRAEIPAKYSESPFHLQYYFEIQPDLGPAMIYPGLTRDYSMPPYYLLRRG